MDRNRRRLVVAVEPTILGDAIMEVLELAGIDEVVDLRDLPAGCDAIGFDGAVVSFGQAGEVEAHVRVELPDNTGASGIGRVWRNGMVQAVAIRDLFSILDVLDRFCPGPAGRRSRVRESAARL